jgi:hypothetical protein
MMASGTRAGNGRFRRTVQSAARDMRAAELHGQGWTHERIAAELGFGSRGRVSEAIERAFAAIVTPGAREAKRLDLERIDRLIELNWAALERRHVTVSNGRVVRRFTGIERDEDGIERLDPDGKVIPVFEDVLDDGPVAVHSTVILRLIERRSRAYSYDEPVHSRVEVITSDAVEANIARLESELAVNDPAHTGSA